MDELLVKYMQLVIGKEGTDFIDVYRHPFGEGFTCTLTDEDLEQLELHAAVARRRNDQGGAGK